MAHNMSGSGGTGDKDDSHFPSLGGFFRGERSSGDGRIPNPVIQDGDNLEAYRGSILSSEQENLLTNLRVEMGITSAEHSSILASASTDPTVQLIRSMRESRGQHASHDTSQLVHNRNPSTSGTGVPFRSFSPESTLIANQQSTSAGTVVGTDRNYPTSGEGSSQFGSHVSSGGRVNELVGTRDGHCFYEGVVTDYNPLEGTHTITYELPTGSVVDSVNLAQLPPGQIQGLSHDAGTLQHGGNGAPERAMNQATGARGRGMGRSSGRGPQSRNDLSPLPTQHPRTGSVEIQILDISNLVVEEEHVVMIINSTPQVRAFAVNKLREHDEVVGETGDDAAEEMNDPVLLPPQEMTGPDENLMLVTDSVLTEAERVMNDSKEKKECSSGGIGLGWLVGCDSEERDRAYDITRVYTRKEHDDANKGKDKIL